MESERSHVIEKDSLPDRERDKIHITEKDSLTTEQRLRQISKNINRY